MSTFQTEMPVQSVNSTSPSSETAFKELLFADQSLEEILFSGDFEDDPELEQAVKNLKENKFAKALQILESSEAKSGIEPYRVLALALAHQNLDELEQAKQNLRQITDSPEAESRMKLLTCTALRTMGEQSEMQMADEVLGVVIEVPVSTGIDTLAAYQDGRARYINYSGGIIIWEMTDGEISTLAKEVVNNAQELATEFPVVESREATKEGYYRFSLLTCGGIRSSELAPESVEENNSTLSTVFSKATQLLVALVEQASDN